MQDISLFDIIIITITLFLGLKGLFRGFIKEVFGLVGIVGGIFVASRISEEVGNKLAPILGITGDSAVTLTGFIASLIGFWILVYLVGMVLSKITSLSGLGTIDRVLGFLFGTGKIFLIFSIIIYALAGVDAIKEKMEEKIGDTIMYPILLESGQTIVKLDTSKFSKEAKENIDTAVETTKQEIEEISIEAAKDKIEEVAKELETTKEELLK